jgi:P27 family predicted phage terminase small subunit
MPAGRPPKAIDLHILEGTFDRRRHAGQADALASGTPVPPKYLKGAALKFWKRVVPELVRAGIAKAIDAPELTLMCQWHARYEKYGKQLDRLQPTAKAFQAVFLAAHLSSTRFNKIASKFGLNPIDRARIRVQAAPSGAKVVQRNRSS